MHVFLWRSIWCSGWYLLVLAANLCVLVVNGWSAARFHNIFVDWRLRSNLLHLDLILALSALLALVFWRDALCHLLKSQLTLLQSIKIATTSLLGADKIALNSIFSAFILFGTGRIQILGVLALVIGGKPYRIPVWSRNGLVWLLIPFVKIETLRPLERPSLRLVRKVPSRSTRVSFVGALVFSKRGRYFLQTFEIMALSTNCNLVDLIRSFDKITNLQINTFSILRLLFNLILILFQLKSILNLL